MKCKLLLAGLVFTSIVVAGNASATHDVSAESVKSMMNGLSGKQKIEIIMSSGSKLTLTNFNTGEKDQLDRPDKMSAEEFLPYVAPIDQIHEFYFFLIEEGKPPWEAMYEANVIALEIISEDETRLQK